MFEGYLARHQSAPTKFWQSLKKTFRRIFFDTAFLNNVRKAASWLARLSIINTNSKQACTTENLTFELEFASAKAMSTYAVREMVPA